MKVLLIAALLLIGAGMAGAASACQLAKPTQPVILTIEGQIKNCNSGLEARFDLPMLEALPKAVVKNITAPA